MPSRAPRNRRTTARQWMFFAVAVTAFIAVVLSQTYVLKRSAHAAAFTPGNLVIYRVGTGSAALTNSATAVFLDEYTTGGVLVQSIAMPTAVSGTNRRLTASGTATSEGLLTRSVDGLFVTLTGYDAATGTAGVASTGSTTVNRVVGRLDSSGSVDTTTALTDSYGGDSFRSAVTTNGTDLWLSGNASSGANAGSRHTTTGATSAAQLSSSPTNLRQTNIFGGQLYVSTASGAFRLATVGTGTPTTSGQTITNLPGFPTATLSPYGFFFADLDAGVAGVDTVYVADDRTSSGGGILKYSLVGGSWVANGNVANALGVRGLTATVSGSVVTLYATASNTSSTSSSFVTLTDTSGYHATITGSFTTLVTASTNTAFRGIAFAPASVSATPSPSPAASPSPALNIGDVTQNEGHFGTSTFTFNVTLTAPAPAGGVSFTVNTANGTTNPATGGSDYVSIVNGSGSISVGNTSTTVNVTVNGDTTSEANETFFVNISNITNAVAGDPQGLGTITNDDVSVTPIYVIQGSGMSSPLVGNNVTTTGIVTGKRSFGTSNYGFYIQDPNGDGNLNTSDGILVFTGSTVPNFVNVGDFVQVSGNVTEFEPSNTDEPNGVSPPDPKTATELTGTTTTVISSGNPLPGALDVTTNNILDPTATSRGAELEKYEFMRLSASSLTVCEPTNHFGEFYGVEPARPRPFREPGIEAGDPVPAADQAPYAPSPPPFPPRFDGNFERIMVDSGAALTTGSTRRPQVQVTTGTLVTNIVGPLDYTFDAYRIVLDATATPGVSGGMTAALPVPARAAGEFTIGHANLENFSASNADRLNKASLAIRNVLRTPDILGLIEIDNLASAQQLASKVNLDASDPGVNYIAYLSETTSPQDIGYLVNTARVAVVGTPQQYHAGTTFTYCGATDTLHDRPSFVLNANMPRDGGGTVSVTVILNHTKSLIAVDSPRSFGSCGTGTEGARNREKRRQQAEDIADLIQTHSTENLVVLGDLNAFDFNDGLGDVVGTFKGNPAPPEQVVEPSVDRWTYNLINLLTTITPGEHYSLLFEGNAQALDHVLVNGQMLAQQTRYAYGRSNADFSESYATDASRPERLADHDAPVAYFLFPADNDNDGVPDANDNCPAVANPDQANADGDSLGDACDACPNDPNNDADGDGVCGDVDNCPAVANADQANADGDSLGDSCDACPNDPNNDADGDGVCGNLDNCPTVANADQANADGDSLGDACDACPIDPANDADGDGVCGNVDNCPAVNNPDQRDTNNDGVGDACTALQFPSEGAFVIGDDVNLAGGATVYFWGSQWSNNNPMSGGSAPGSFKGFENGNTSPTCGGTWTSNAGSSANPPPTIPQYMAVIVSSSIQKNGSGLSGDIQKIVIVRTHPGYGPSPGQAGTGEVIAILCTSSTQAKGWRLGDPIAFNSSPLFDFMYMRPRLTARW